MPIGGGVAADVPAQVERLGELCRRYAGEPEAMMAEAILEAELDVLQNQRRSVAKLVAPGDRRVMNDNPALPQQPPGEAFIVRPRFGVDR